MCQVNEKKLNKWNAIGYRIYVEDKSGNLESYGSHKSMTSIGKKVYKDTNEPFHACKTLKDAALMVYADLNHFCLLCREKDIYRVHIYKVKLEGDLKQGIWSCSDIIKTITGDYCTVIGEVDHYNVKG